MLIQAKDPNDESRIKEYSLIIKYKSSNADLELVKVDNKDAIKMEDEYYATTTVDALKSQIFAKAVNKYAKVSINGFDKEVIMLDTDMGLRNLDLVMGIEDKVNYNILDQIRVNALKLKCV